MRTNESLGQLETWVWSRHNLSGHTLQANRVLPLVTTSTGSSCAVEAPVRFSCRAFFPRKFWLLSVLVSSRKMAEPLAPTEVPAMAMAEQPVAVPGITEQSSSCFLKPRLSGQRGLRGTSLPGGLDAGAMLAPVSRHGHLPSNWKLVSYSDQWFNLNPYTCMHCTASYSHSHC